MSFRYPTPLPDEAIDRLFSALVVRYGEPFTHRWRDLDLAVVKGDWARELGCFIDNLGAIRYALDHLPEKPPTVIEFKRLCHESPAPQPERALVYNHGPVRGPTSAEREKLRALSADIKRGTVFAKPDRQWAYDLIRCDAEGWRNNEAFRATPTSLAMAREAIAFDPNRPGASASFDDYQEAA